MPRDETFSNLIAACERQLEQHKDSSSRSKAYAEIGSWHYLELFSLAEAGLRPLRAALAQAAYTNALREEPNNVPARNGNARLLLLYEEKATKALPFLESIPDERARYLWEDFGTECERLQLSGIAFLLLGDEKKFLEYFMKACSERFRGVIDDNHCEIELIRHINVKLTDSVIRVLRELFDHTMVELYNRHYCFSILDLLARE